MAKHTYTKTKGGSISGNGSTKTYTTGAFTISASEQFSAMQVRTNNSTPQLRGSALNYFGGLNIWKTTTPPSAVWSNGNGANIQFVNSSSSTVSMTVTVHWVTSDKSTYTVSCDVSGSGTLTCSPSNTYWGNTITLSPSAATGWQLSSYSSNPSVTISNNTFTLPQSNVTVTANFTRRNYTLTVSHNGYGTVTGGGTYAYQAVANITATAGTAGYVFDHWVVSGTGTIGSTTSDSTTFTIGAGNATVQAVFVPDSITTYYPIEDITWETSNNTLTIDSTNLINTTTHANDIRSPAVVRLVLGVKR